METCSGGDDVNALVVDPGFDYTKFGHCQEDTPRVVLESQFNDEDDCLLNRYFSCANKYGQEIKYNIDIEIFENLLYQGVLGSKYPNETNFKNWPTIFNDQFRIESLCSSLTEHPILVTEPSLESRPYREAVAEIIFEKVSSPASYIAKRAALSAFAFGRANALVIDIGGGGLVSAPVYEGTCLQCPLIDLPLGGQCLDELLLDVLKKDGVEVKGGLATTRDFKEMFFSDTYTMPDGTIIETSKYKELAIDHLMLPGESTSNIIEDYPGLPDTIFDTLLACDVDIRKDLLTGIIFTGGISLLSGLSDKLLTGINNQKYFGSLKYRLILSNNTIERKYSTWLGGSILTSLGKFQQLWISKAEYGEHGMSIIDRKCR